MTLRLIVGLGWSLAAGLAGGWLVLSPWALGEQGNGDWTTVTRTEVPSGLGLLVLAVAGPAPPGRASGSARPWPSRARPGWWRCWRGRCTWPCGRGQRGRGSRAGGRARRRAGDRPGGRLPAGRRPDRRRRLQVDRGRR